MRKQLKNFKMWRRAVGLHFCAALLCLLMLGGCARDLGRGARASSSAIGGAASAASSTSSAYVSAVSSSLGRSQPVNSTGSSSSSGASVSSGESQPGGAISSSGSSVSAGSSANSASSGSGAASPPLSSSASQAGSGGVKVGEGLNNLLVLVNRENALPADYIPAGLTKLTVPFASNALPERRQLRKEAAEAIVLLFEAAK